jgi:alpha-tubulin suppressor-like RCC1 family protein
LEKIDVQSVHCGDHFTLALTRDGLLLSWGSNEYGQLGIEVDAIPFPDIGYHKESFSQNSKYIETSFKQSNTSVNSRKRRGCTMLNDKTRKMFKVNSSENTPVYSKSVYSRFLHSNHEEFLQTLGSRSKNSITQPILVEKLQNTPIIQAAVGINHCLVLGMNGYVYSWGSNENYQLGLSSLRFIKQLSSPEIVKFFIGKSVKSVACGPNYSCVVTTKGEVYIWGKIGLYPNITEPRMISLIEPVDKVACGGSFLLMLTESGRVFRYGDETVSKAKTKIPEVTVALDYFLGDVIIDIACGFKNAFVCDKKNRVFLVSPSKSNFRQKKDPELLKITCKKITQISCSDNHVLILCDGKKVKEGKSRLELESFADFTKCTQLTVSLALSSPSTLASSFDSIVCQSFTGEGHSIKENKLSIDYYNPVLSGFSECLNLLLLNLETTLKMPFDDLFFTKLMSVFIRLNKEVIFCNNTYKKFLFYCCVMYKEFKFKFSKMLTMEELTEFVNLIKETVEIISADGGYECTVFDQMIDDVIFDGLYLLSKIYEEVRGNESDSGVTIEGRVEQFFSKACEFPLSMFYLSHVTFLDMKLEYFHWQFTKPTTSSNRQSCYITTIPHTGPITLKNDEFFNFTGKTCFSFCAFPFLFDADTKFVLLQIDACRKMFQTSNLSLFNNVVTLLSEGNESSRRSTPLFGNLDNAFSSLLRSVYPLSPGSSGNNGNNGNTESTGNTGTNGNSNASMPDSQRNISDIFEDPLPRFPDLFGERHEDESPENSILRSIVNSVTDAISNGIREGSTNISHPNSNPSISINITRSGAQEDTQNDSLMLTLVLTTDSPYFTVKVNRQTLLEDAITRLKEIKNDEDPKKPLRVVFENEEGLDEGGITKEFFHLISAAILDEKNGLFSFTESGNAWLSSAENENLKYVGMLFGLALYNSCLLNVNFPTILFKKLLKYPIKFEDFSKMRPEMSSHFQFLLDYNGVESLGLSFAVDDSFGKRHELIENGSNVDVTDENKRKYVYLYIDYLCNKIVEKQYKLFSDGFAALCHGPVLQSFHPSELDLLIGGSVNFKFGEEELRELKGVTQYKNGYFEKHDVVQMFWSVFDQFSEEQKKRFFFFLTGSDRLPIKMSFTIQRVAKSSDRLPAAHTCFNILDLPEYDSMEQLRSKLLYAMENTEGFGLV